MERNSKGQFSYIFDRTINNHVRECKCLECELRLLVNSREMLSLLGRITQENLIKSRELFLAKYQPGDFLSRHTDDSRGKVGFVYYLNKSWKEEYGGNLNIYHDNQLKQKVIPGYNKLLLFDVQNSKTPHEVTYVSASSPYARYSFSGWLE